MCCGLNRRVTAFMDLQDAENLVKVWDKKHHEDIQSMCYHHPNVLVTASYDGDLIVWSTETNQPACRLNFTESSKPMLGSDRPKKVESQRAIIAKRFNLARTRGANPGASNANKLGFMDMMRARLASAADEIEKERAAETVADKAASKDLKLAPPSLAQSIVAPRPPALTPAGFGKPKIDAVLMSNGTSEESLATTMENQLPQSARLSSVNSPFRCPYCFGIKKWTQQGQNADKRDSFLLCCCHEDTSISMASSRNSRKSSGVQTFLKSIPFYLQVNTSLEPTRSNIERSGDDTISIQEHDEARLLTLNQQLYVDKPTVHTLLSTNDQAGQSATQTPSSKSSPKQSTFGRFSARARNTLRALAAFARKKPRQIENTSQGSSTSTPTSMIAVDYSKTGCIKKLLKTGPQEMISSTCISCVVALKERKVDRKTAVILASGVDGWIRAWSIHYKGGLIGQFRCSERPYDAVTCMTVDEKNHYLFTGDSHGYIKVWYIADYCTKYPYSETLTPEQKHQLLDQRYKSFPYYPFQKYYRRFTKHHSQAAKESINPAPIISDPEKTVHKPILLSSFKAHTKGITCIMFADRYQLLVTGSDDNNIRVWTIGGRYLGQLGTHTWSKLIEGDETWKDDYEFGMPKDIRCIASPRTLRVLNGGMSRRWRFVKTGLMLLVGPWFRFGTRAAPKEEAKNARSSQASEGIEDISVLTGHRKPVSARSIEQHQKYLDSMKMPDAPYDINCGKSSILGKFYKKQGCHKAAPHFKEFLSMDQSIQVWPKVASTEVEDVIEEHSTPDMLVKRNERKKYYTQQLLRAQQATEALTESVLGGNYKRIDFRSPLDTRASSPIGTPASLQQGSLASKRKQFLVTETNYEEAKNRKFRPRQRRTVESETVDRLALEIAEILGEANNHGQDPELTKSRDKRYKLKY